MICFGKTVILAPGPAGGVGNVEIIGIKNEAH
jgi:hypothetical protein